MNGRWLLCSLFLCGCWPAPASTERPEEEPILLLRSPEGVVGPDQAVEVRFPVELFLVFSPSVFIEDGPIEAQVDEVEEGVVLRPLPRWPEGATVTVDFTGALAGPDGTPPIVPLSFFVARAEAESPTPMLIRRPVPGRPAPTNLAWLSVVLDEAPSLRFEAPGGDGFSAAADASVGTARVYRLLGGALCTTLCPETVYRWVDPPGALEGPLGEVRTGTTKDERPPVVRRLSLFAEPGALAVDLEVDEVVQARGTWQSPSSEGQLLSTSEPDARARLEAVPPPPPGERLTLTVELEDLAGQVTSTGAALRTPPNVRLEIAELVPSPRSDWGDSEPMGAPFDPWPGRGTVSSADEWVEIVNRGPDTVDLRGLGLELRAIDGSPAVTAVLSAPYFWFGDGGRPEAFLPGEALVVRTRGDMAQKDLRLELWAGALRLDQIVLASRPEADHPGGAPPDLIHEALARGADGVLRWCRPTPGDPTPPTRCRRE